MGKEVWPEDLCEAKAWRGSSSPGCDGRGEAARVTKWHGSGDGAQASRSTRGDGGLG